jgi:Flp pilus assembly protein TadG
MTRRLSRKPANDSANDTKPASDRGTMIVWWLVLIPLMYGIGGLGLDLWRVISERRALAEAADASARAGANGIDEAVFDETGALVLDPARAEDLANANLDEQDADTLDSMTRSDISSTTEQVRVEIDGQVDMTLLRIFGADSIEVHVESEAEPQEAVQPSSP